MASPPGPISDFAEPVIGRRFAPTRWLHPGYKLKAACYCGPKTWNGDKNVAEIADRLVRCADHAVQQGRLGRFCRVSDAAQIPGGSRHVSGADHGLDRRGLDAVSGGKKE